MCDFFHTDDFAGILLDDLDDGVGIGIACLGCVGAFEHQDETILVPDQVNLSNRLKSPSSVLTSVRVNIQGTRTITMTVAAAALKVGWLGESRAWTVNS